MLPRPGRDPGDKAHSVLHTPPPVLPQTLPTEDQRGNVSTTILHLPTTKEGGQTPNQQLR